MSSSASSTATPTALSSASTERLFLELDRVRKMQAELSLTHLAQARQFPTSLGEDDKDEDALHTYRRNNEYVTEKEDKVRILVEKLNELTNAIEKSITPSTGALGKPSVAPQE